MINSMLDLSLPYITAGIVGVGGRLRARPEHFVVEEIPLYEPEDHGQHLYVNLTKVNLTTRDVQKGLAKCFHIKIGDVGFAGMKDKDAVTIQTFSLNVGHRDGNFVAEARQQIEKHLDVRVNWLRFHRNKLRRGHLLGNRFAIVVTDLAVPVPEAMEQAQLVADSLRQTGLPNYFGPQRFGGGGRNVHQGLDVLLKRRRVKGRWLRQFLISSVQSYLCNCYLARRVEAGNFGNLLAGDVAKKYDTGGMFDVEDLPVEQARYDAKEISFTAPLYGTKMWSASGESGALEASILAESPISLDDLVRARVAGTRRLGRLLVPDLVIEDVESSEDMEGTEAEGDSTKSGIRVTFTLPKGAYATILLREIMKRDLGSESVSEPDEEEF